MIPSLVSFCNVTDSKLIASLEHVSFLYNNWKSIIRDSQKRLNMGDDEPSHENPCHSEEGAIERRLFLENDSLQVDTQVPVLANETTHTTDVPREKRLEDCNSVCAPRSLLLLILPDDPYMNFLLQLAMSYSGPSYLIVHRSKKTSFPNLIEASNHLLGNSNYHHILRSVHIHFIESQTELRNLLILFVECDQLLPRESRNLIIIDQLSLFSTDQDMSEKRPDAHSLALLEMLPCDYCVSDLPQMDISFYCRFFKGLVCKIFPIREQLYAIQSIRQHMDIDPIDVKIVCHFEEGNISVEALEFRDISEE